VKRITALGRLGGWVLRYARFGPLRTPVLLVGPPAWPAGPRESRAGAGRKLDG
jgi:hypothetical protein